MISDLRTRLPLQVGDDATAELYTRRVAQARTDGARLGRRFVVSPLCRIQVRKDVWLSAGDEIRLSDFDDTDVPPVQQLQQLVHSGRVLETDFIDPNEPDGGPPMAA